MKIIKIKPERQPYLAPLKDIPQPPAVIFSRGSLPPQRRPSVAIVGSRKPTAYGREVAARLAAELAGRGVVVVSGLALGIDSVAHRAALDAGGITLAVLANSVDHVYPRAHTGLGEEIIRRGGALLSEYEPPTELRPHYLLARNRIVSGLADAVIIVEAAARSGTLATAAHALDQGRPVLAVPGNITSPLSAGCNALIKQGAFPLTSVDDVLELIAPGQTGPVSALPAAMSPLEAKLIELLRAGIRDGDELQHRAGADASQFNQALTMMELNGLIAPLGANRWSLK